jgi:DNA-directed RNA polymerase subunit RPC12/RpoP
MLNICVNCGLYRPDKIVDPTGPYAICPECGHRHLFRALPLFIVSGASGAGKSTVCHHLLGKVTEVVGPRRCCLMSPHTQRGANCPTSGSIGPASPAAHPAR